MANRDKVLEWAESVFNAIPVKEQGGAWKPGRQIDAETGLDPYQRRLAVEYINKMFQGDDLLPPLASSNKGYLFTTDVADLTPYVVQGARQANTLLENRFWRAASALYRLSGDMAALARSKRAMERLHEDIENTLVEMMVSNDRNDAAAEVAA